MKIRSFSIIYSALGLATAGYAVFGLDSIFTQIKDKSGDVRKGIAFTLFTLAFIGYFMYVNIDVIIKVDKNDKVDKTDRFYKLYNVEKIIPRAFLLNIVLYGITLIYLLAVIIMSKLKNRGQRKQDVILLFLAIPVLVLNSIGLKNIMEDVDIEP